MLPCNVCRRFSERSTERPYVLQRTTARVFGEVAIEHGVWLADWATEMKGARIGNVSAVTAGSMVTSEVPLRTVVGSVPARVLRTF